MVILILLFFSLLIIAWFFINRKYESSASVASAYDSWTNDQLLERLWGEHIHLGYYNDSIYKTDFRQAKSDFVHQLVNWSGINNLPKGSRIIDVGCGIGGSSRILAKYYGFDVLGITISPLQVERAKKLTPDNLSCEFRVMDALDLHLEDSTFDAVWSVEAGAHILNKQLYADEMLRVLRPGGFFAIADWNRRDSQNNELGILENIVMKQLLEQWSHPEFSSIKSFRENLLTSRYSRFNVDCEDWTKFTIPSWNDSILEGFRRPNIFLELGPKSFLNGFREIPTILLMRWAFSTSLMQFGVYRSLV